MKTQLLKADTESTSAYKQFL